MAELKLDVTLNIAGFRSQLGKLAQTAGAYYYPVNVLINKKNLTTQLEAIGRTLGKKKYRIDLNDTSVGLAADKIEKLATSLKNLSGSIKIDFNAGGGTKTIGTAMKEMATKMAKESKGDINKAVAKMVEMRGEAPFGSGTRSIPGFKSAAKGMGVESAFKLFFQELNQIDPQKLRKALDDGSVMMMGENRELKQKFDKIQSSAESLAQDLRAMGETARTTGKASLSTGGKTLYPQNYGLKIASLLSQIDKLGKDLRKVSAQSGTELLDNLTELTSVLRTTSNSFVGISGFSDSLDQTLRRFDTATKTATAATNAYADRINRRAGGVAGGAAAATAGPGLLPGRAPGGALAISSKGDAYKVIEVQVRSAFNIIEDYHKTQLDNFTRNYKNIIDNYHKAILTQQLINAAQRPAVVTEGPGLARLPGTRIAGLLPPSVGRTPSPYSTAGETTQELFARREREARMRSALRGVDITREGGVNGRPESPYRQAYRGARPREAIVPYAKGGALVPSSGGEASGGAPGLPSTQLGAGYYSVGKALNSVKSSYGQVKEFLNTKALPLTGAITGLAGEFGGAIKQVLLFGTAYKALAFLTSIPGEALDAAKGLATYKNQLKAVTSESQTFDQSLAFVDNLAQRFNTPLESARQGFVKLYASMQPVGFNQGEIENLFTGISKAAAAFGLSSDKVDRVNYAFAQMASKGQIMSEELKGQLGDVLPGALGLFAKAAQMSIPEFTKAMEDGAFQGKAMQQVLGNVAILMNSQYGPAAEGAAKTLQGAMNQIQNNLKLMYESFAPFVDRFAAAFGPEINSLIKDVSSTVQALTGNFAKAGEGFSALSPRAQSFYIAIQTLEPSLRQAGAAVLDLTSRFATLVPAIIQTIATAISFASSPLARAAILAAIAIGTLTAALKILEVTGLKAALKAVYAFISGILGIPAATGTARLGIIALKLALTGIFVGAILMGLDFLIGKLLGIGDAAAKSKKEIQELDRELDVMAGAGDLEGTTKAFLEANTNLVKANKESRVASERVAKMKTAAQIVSGDSNEENARNKMANDILIADAEKASEKAFNKELLARKQLQSTRTARDSAKNIKERQNEESLKQEGKLEKIDLSGDDKTKKTNLESYYNLQDQLAKASTQADIDRINAIFEHRKFLINSVYDLEEARANSIQKEAIAHQKTVANIFLDLQKKQIDARLDVLKVQGSVAGGAATAGGVPGAGGTTGSTGLLQGRTGTATGPHFHVARQNGGRIGEQQARALFDPSVNSQLTMTSPYGERPAPTAGASTFHRGVDLAGKANTPLNLAAGYSMTGAGEKGGLGYAASVRGPAGEMYDVGHLQRPSAASAGAPRKVSGDVKRDVLATQGVEIAQQKQSLLLTHSQKEAQIALNIAKETYLAQIFGIAEKELQLGQSQKQIALLKAGFTDNEIEDEMKLETIRLKQVAGINEARKAIASNNALKAQGIIDQEELNKRNAHQNDLINRFNKELPQSIKLQQDLNKAGKDYTFTGRIKALEKEIQLLATAGDAERRLLELREGGLTPKEAQQIYSLEKVKKNLEDTKALIGNFVSSTSSDYKGFLKAVISGEDAVDALQKFQAGLADKVLTIFLDFAMAPMEEMMKKSLEGLFMPKVNTTEVPVVANTTELTKNTAATIANTNAITGKIQMQPYDPAKSLPGIPDFSKNAFNISPESAFAGFNTENMLTGLNTEDMFAGLNDQIRAGLAEIPSSFAEATANLQISSEPFKQALIADLPNALDAAGKGVQTQGATFGEGLTNFVGGLGAAAAGVAGIAAGISQIGKGGTSNVLGGIGSILLGAGGAIGGFGKLFGFAEGGRPPIGRPSLVGELGPELFVPSAAGMIIPADATAAMARYQRQGGGNDNEPDPAAAMARYQRQDGNLGGMGSNRTITNSANNTTNNGYNTAGNNTTNNGYDTDGNNDTVNNIQTSPSPVLAFSFETTRFLGQDYVSTDQLQAAMMATEKRAAAAGAKAGAAQITSKLQQSPAYRRQVGLR